MSPREWEYEKLSASRQEIYRRCYRLGYSEDEVLELVDAIAPPVERLVALVASNPDLNDCWADEDEDGHKTYCAGTDLPEPEWCWPCQANAALAPFRGPDGDAE